MFHRQLSLLAIVVGASVAQENLQESLDIVVPVPPRPVKVDGRLHLSYELHLTNFATEALELRSIRVVDATPGRALAVLNRESLMKRVRLVRPESSGLSMSAGDRAVLYVDLDTEAFPEALTHEVEVSAGGRLPFTLKGASTKVDRLTPIALGPPLRGAGWVAVYHSEWARGHRRVFYALDGGARIPGRFAIDFVKVDGEGKTRTGDADRAASAIGYGADVLAVANAEVVAVRDGVKESSNISENPKHSLEEAPGNYIVLRPRAGVFVIYEHLKPGSIRVKTGTRVRRGQVIAGLGFTGDSTGPHLHVHVADGPAPLKAEGIPFVFERFELLGRYPDIAALGKTIWQAVEPGPRHNERPGPNVVLKFPD